MMKKLSIFVTLVVSFTLLFAIPVAAEEEYVADEVVVQFKTDTEAAVVENLMKNLKMKKVKDSWKPGKFTVFKNDSPGRPLAQLIKALLKETNVANAELNYIARATLSPNDPYYSYQWHMTRIGMEDAWDESTGSGVTVAVNDSGVKQSLADLAQTNFVAGYDFINSDNDPTDDHGHGSHVCGTIAQSTNNSVGVTGVAYNCSIMPVKVLNASGSGSYTQIADGIYWAVDHGADIINMSLGGSSSSSTLQNACNYAWNNGVVVVCAAGNSSSSSPFYPAAYTVCISVSAINSADGLASYSNYGSTIDICGPGGDNVDRDGDGYIDGVLQNTFDSSGDGYFFYYGTSMASPHVAGVAALVWSIDSGLTNAEVRDILETTAEDLGTSGWDQYFGYGLVDAYAACLEAGGTPDITPPVISNVTAVNITDDSADIEWDTDENATSVVYYGLTTSYGSSETVGGYVKNHSVPLSGLAPDTLYHYKVESSDSSGNTSESGDYTFTTLPESAEPEMYVYDISMVKNSFWIIYRASATITIKDTDGNFVPNATVYTTWSGKWSGTRSGTTNSNGQVTLTTSWVWGNGTFTVTVTDVTHATLTYNPALNNETSDSI
jgi:serine protease